MRLLATIAAFVLSAVSHANEGGGATPGNRLSDGDARPAAAVVHSTTNDTRGRNASASSH